MDIQTWYGQSVNVPELGNWRFDSFVTSCLGIVRTILKEKLGDHKISVIFQKGGTAAASQKNNSISINEEYLQGKLTQCGNRTVQMDSTQTLSLLMGLLVHETAHFAYSDATLEPAMEFIRQNTKAHYEKSIAAAIANIVEDIFIEAEVDRDVPSLTWMIDQMNGLYFDNQDLDNRMQAALSVESAPENEEQLKAAGDFLVLAKVLGHANGLSRYMTDLFYLARSAVFAQERQQRYELSLAVYDTLMEKMPASECKGVGDDMRDDAKGVTAGHETVKDGQTVKGVTRSSDEISASLEKLEDAVLHLAPAEDSEELRLGDIYIEVPLPRGRAVNMDRRYEGLATVARQNAVVNRPYGLDRNRGNHLRKLHRIATDNKIFAEPMPTRIAKPMQVLILLDCSGSMNHVVDYRRRIDMAKEATLGAAFGLLEGRCEVAVYGHTSEVFGDADVVLYRAKGFNESYEGLSHRLGSIGNVFCRMSQNRDGCAIRYIYPKLNNKNKHRLLIVVSDGEPAATGYYGKGANLHTKSAVEEARKAGIDVLSISISAEAGKVNDFIYGKEWNVYNENPNVLADIVARLVTH